MFYRSVAIFTRLFAGLESRYLVDGAYWESKNAAEAAEFWVQEEMPFGVSWRKRNLHRMSCAVNSIIECWSRRMFKLLEGRETNNT